MTATWTICFRDLLPEERYSHPMSERLLQWLLDAVCRPGFRHCFAYADLPHEMVLVLDARANGLEAAVHLAPTFRGLTHTVRAKPCFQRGWRPRGLLTCVTVVKHLLGIRAWWILTPHQLYRYLQQGGQ